MAAVANWLGFPSTKEYLEIIELPKFKELLGRKLSLWRSE